MAAKNPLGPAPSKSGKAAAPAPKKTPQKTAQTKLGNSGTTNALTAAGVVPQKTSKNPNGPDRAAKGYVYKGGICKDLKDPVTRRNVPGTEINHIPSTYAIKKFGIKTREGTAIQMDYLDHRKVLTTGWSEDTQDWLGLQEAVLGTGDIDLAIDGDIHDVKGKFGTKYDGAIRQMLAVLPNHVGYQKVNKNPLKELGDSVALPKPLKSK